MDKLRQRFPHVLVLAYEPEGATADPRSYRARVAGRDNLTVTAEFVQHVRNAPVTPGERKLLAAAFEQARRAGSEPAVPGGTRSGEPGSAYGGEPGGPPGGEPDDPSGAEED
jgi:exonuclease SbcD